MSEELNVNNELQVKTNDEMQVANGGELELGQYFTKADFSGEERKLIIANAFEMIKKANPRLYKNFSDKDVASELESIAFVTSHIDNKTLKVMCEWAIKQYPIDESEKPNTTFNINYILRFFKTAFEYANSDSIEINRGSEVVHKYYDELSDIVYETWDDHGEYKRTASFCTHGDCGGKYSKKFFEQLNKDLDGTYRDV